MAEFNIGKVIPQFKGIYKEGIYEDLDVVAHNNGTWVSMTNNNTTEPSEDNTKWKLVMQSPISQSDANNISLYFSIIGARLDDISKKIEENTSDIKEQHGLVLDSLNTTAYTRTKLNEFSQRLSKIEKKLGI